MLLQNLDDNVDKDTMNKSVQAVATPESNANQGALHSFYIFQIDNYKHTPLV
jgi:hypothetical protein